jgi:hypothetical protein
VLAPLGDGEVMVDINTTPLIDVMLVLLIMLIITIPIQTHAVKLNMPVGNPPPGRQVRRVRHRDGGGEPGRADQGRRHRLRAIHSEVRSS